MSRNCQVNSTPADVVASMQTRISLDNFRFDILFGVVKRIQVDGWILRRFPTLPGALTTAA